MAIVEKVDGFFIPNVTLIGVGAAKAIPERIVYLNATKPLLVTDKGIVHTGILKQITDILDEAAMEYAIYDETVPNPTDLNVAAGVELYKKEECDSLISIGGGSSHDCCKGIGLVVSNGGKIHDYEGVDKSTKAMPPYLAVNTTAGTASEITRFCIITDSARKVKMAIVDWRITPSVAINDPILMVGMPPALTAATGMDALTHAVEAYVSTGATPLTDACAEKAIKLVSENLRRAVANGSDIHAREGMCYAQYLAGMAFNNASLGHVHAMAHQLGGFYNLPHGECNAILLPIVEEYNLLAHLDKFINIARMMDENIDGLSKRDAAELAISAIRRLSQDVGIPASITELAKRYGKEVSRSDIPTMVANAQKDACGLTNPRKMTDAAVQQLPPPAKTSTGGEAARQKFRCVESKERAALCFLYIFFCWRGAAECHSSIHPFEIFRGKLFQNCPAATSNTGQRTPVTVRKMKRKRPEPNAGFRPFLASKAPLAGEPSHPSIRRRSLPAWRVPRSHGGFAWRRLRPR